jgi:hypothetical protein
MATAMKQFGHNPLAAGRQPGSYRQSSTRSADADRTGIPDDKEWAMNVLTTRWRLTIGAVAVAVLASVGVIGATIAPAAAASRTDAYTMDASDDFGNEPSTSVLPIWASPDIRVCNTAVFCAVSQNPIVGATNYVFITLRNPGPYGSGPSAGVMNVYWTNPSGATVWPVDWTLIGSQAVTAYPGVTTISIPWTSVPGPGHFCLLSRWVSPTDPMTFEGPNSQANTKANNNISWRNVDTVRPAGAGNPDGGIRQFYLGNVVGVPAVNDLRFNLAGHPYTNGTLVVDLGQTLYTRWQQAGGKGVAVTPIGGTKLKVLDPAVAQIDGLLVNPGERPNVTLTFGETATLQGLSAISLVQYGPATAGTTAATALGGVEFDVSDRQ